MIFSKKLITLMFTSIFILLVMIGCNNNEESNGSSDEDGVATENSEEEKGGDLIMAIPDDVSDLDSHGAVARLSNTVKFQIYERLLEPNEENELEPILAESYEQLDENTYEFKLREGISFHDGEEFNAEAVKKNIERLLDPEFGSPLETQFNMIDKVEVEDEYTIRFVLEYPYQSFLKALSHYGGGMISPKAIEQDYNDEIKLKINPVGTGPFKFEEWDQGNEIRLTKNDDYWGEEVYLDSLTYKVIPEQLSRVGMLETGEIDIADQIEPINANRVETMDNAELIDITSLRSFFLGFNTEKKPFDNVDVRKAFSMVIDKTDIAEGIYDGYAKTALGPMNNLIFGYNDNLDQITYDLDKAKELLDDTEYDYNSSIDIWVRDHPTSVQTGEYLQDQLSKIDVESKVQKLEQTSFLAETGEGKHDIYIGGWANSLGDPDDTLYRQFHSKNKGSAGNRYFYANEEVDELLDQARKESDEKMRDETYQKIQKILHEDVPRVDLVNPDYILGISKSVKGYIQYPTEHHSFKEAYILKDKEDDEYK